MAASAVSSCAARLVSPRAENTASASACASSARSNSPSAIRACPRSPSAAAYSPGLRSRSASGSTLSYNAAARTTSPLRSARSPRLRVAESSKYASPRARAPADRLEYGRAVVAGPGLAVADARQTEGHQRIGLHVARLEEVLRTAHPPGGVLQQRTPRGPRRPGVDATRDAEFGERHQHPGALQADHVAGLAEVLERRLCRVPAGRGIGQQV